MRVKARAMTTCSQSTKEKWEILIEKLENLKLMASEALDELQEEVAMAKEMKIEWKLGLKAFLTKFHLTMIDVYQ